MVVVWAIETGVWLYEGYLWTLTFSGTNGCSGKNWYIGVSGFIQGREVFEFQSGLVAL